MEYKELLNVMKKKYFELCGYHVPDASEIGIRFCVVAGAMIKLKDKLIEEYKNTSFLTAEGNALDSFGKLLNIARESKKATGKLRIFKNIELKDEVIIDKGTWFIARNQEILRFETIEECKIGKEESFKDVLAQAEEPSEAYNVSVGTINELYKEMKEVTAITNITAFEGGFQQESDEDYRNRIIETIKIWLKERREK